MARIIDLNLFLPPKPIGFLEFGTTKHPVFPLSSLSVADYCAFIDMDEHVRTLSSRDAVAELGRLLQKLAPSLTDAEIRSWRAEQLGKAVVAVKQLIAEDLAQQASGGSGTADPPMATPDSVS